MRKNELSDNNFGQTLPATQAMFANEVFRSSYNLGFLGVKDPILETELETRLVEKVKQFLLELGKGFTYIGNQYVLEYNGKRSKVDMVVDIATNRELSPSTIGLSPFFVLLFNTAATLAGQPTSIALLS